MFKNKIRLPLLLVSGIFLGSALYASPRSAKADYHALAIEPPARKEAQYSNHDDGDEIDREIEAYFGQLNNRSRLNVDRQKLDQLFGRGGTAGNSRTTTFRNYSPFA